MAGAVRKVAIYLGLLEDDGYDVQSYDPDDEDYGPEPEPLRTGRTEEVPRPVPRPPRRPPSWRRCARNPGWLQCHPSHQNVDMSRRAPR